MELVDSHCHLDRIPNYDKPKNIIPVTVGYSHTSNKKCAEIASKLKIPYVLGIAPQTAMNEDLSKLDEWINFILDEKPNAIGEIGLDYHWAENDQHIQKEQIVYSRMLNLASQMDLPIVMHARQAVSEVLDFLDLQKFNSPFMMHFFSGSLSEAMRAIDMGGLISITPLHSKSRRTIIKEIDLEHLLVETDAPYVVRTPQEVIKSVEYISEIKGVSHEEVAKVTSRNAKKFFKV
jgi:TatD DNase family protein